MALFLTMFDVLFFGAETQIGQVVLKAINEQYPGISIVVPMSDTYHQNIYIPENQVYLDFNDLGKSLQLVDFQVIVNCNPSLILPEKYKYKVVDGTISFPQIVVYSGCAKLRYDIKDLSVFESSSLSMFISYALSGSPNLPSPSVLTRTTTIESDVIPLGKINVKYYISFKSDLLAYLFWFFAYLLHILLFFLIRKRSNGSKTWTFKGKTGNNLKFERKMEVNDKKQLVAEYVLWCLREKLKIKGPLNHMFSSLSVTSNSFK